MASKRTSISQPREVVISLKGKTAVVTGSTSGIGLGIAVALAQAGANIVMNGLGSEADNQAAIREVAKSGNTGERSTAPTCCGTTKSPP